MEKERIDVFGDGKMLSDGKACRSAAHRRGGMICQTLALGTAIFSMIFIFCCFFVGMRAAGTQINETTADAAAVDGTQSSSPAVTTAVTVPKESETPEPETDSSQKLPEGFDIYAFDKSLVPSSSTAILPYDLSLSSYGNRYIFNDTAYSPNLSLLLSTDRLPKFQYINAAVYPASEPVVLIIHTHGTEAYSEEGSVAYDGVSSFARSSDTSENVVAVGEVLAEVLNSHGIKTLHCTVMHDKESYRDSYLRSAATIREYLKQYPSIQYVIDVHRDAVSSSSGAILRPVTVADGVAAAQVMCVVGSDAGGADYPGWQNNLSFALRLRAALNEKYGNIARPVYLRSSAYNQQYAPVSMLLEIGAGGNYLSEAKTTARIVGEILADLIKN